MTGRRIAHWEWASALAVALLAAWLLRPEAWWALTAGLAAVAGTALAVGGRPWVAVVIGVPLLGGAGLAFTTSRGVARVEREWDVDSTGVRWQLVAAAGERLSSDLAAAVAEARRLADEAITLRADRAGAFAALARAVGGGGPERGVVLFDTAGRPWAWAGRNRLPPATLTGLEARITPFYAVLSAGRQGAEGSFAVAQVTLSADSAVPDRERTLGARFERASGVGLRFFPPGRGPYWADVFDYCTPACDTTGVVPDTLFSVLLQPPGQGPIKLALLARGSRWVALVTVLTPLLLLVTGGFAGRVLALAALGGLLVLWPVGRHLPLGRLFSPATFFSDTLGPLSASAGALLVTAALVLMGGAWLSWRQRPFRHAWILALGLVAAAPLVLQRLAAGITPPAEGADLALSVQWQLTVALASAAWLLVATALMGRPGSTHVPRWTSVVAASWAAGAALVGILTWAPGVGWPAWYLYLWLPAVGLAVLPAPRGRTLGTLAAVAGAVAAVLTWGAAAEGRILLAERDVSGLRQGGDPVAVGLLERFGARLQEEEAPRNAGELYARWHRSTLEADRYPATLAAWSSIGTLRARLDLATLDLGDSTLLRIAETARDRHTPAVEAIPAVPGVHYVLSVPFPDGSVVTVGLGPRTRASTPVRVARFLRGERILSPPYTLTLSEPVGGGGLDVRPGMSWRREGDAARGEERLVLPGGIRHLHATVPLGGAAALLVRGVLLIVLDLAVFGVLWFAAEAVAGRFRLGDAARGVLSRRSYRTRLALAFAVFFVIPTVAFAAWSATRLGVDAQRTRDVMVRQTLLDAAGNAREFAAMPGVLARELLGDLASRLDAELLLYDDGQLRQSSAPVLAELGVLDWFLPPGVQRALTTGDEIDVAVDQRIADRPTRVGYRRIGGTAEDAVVLAAPRLVEDPELLRSEQDLALGLLLVTLGGLGAAGGLATVAARALAKPVQALQAAAEEVRRGQLPSPFAPDAPGEFVPVMAAFERMASDVHASRAALEAQRQRTAAVLRNVATGVLALDDRFRVVTSNPRAEEVLGCSLRPGAHVAEVTAPRWQPVWEWLRGVAQGRDDSEPREFELDDRQIRVQLAPLTGAASGWVVAIDDVTDLARAVRVLAWGELARQIAHEIKNPLTPIRLGVQHLRRAYDAPRGDYAATLDRTSRQILAEIERLDAIARAFSRFGAPPAGTEPLGRVDAVEVARDTAALYALAEGADVRVEGDGPIPVRARRDELKEVLINLIENARAAHASRVAIAVAGADEGAVVAVRDNGDGIAPTDLPRIFEPQFSTTTSGTGLGLAICKRLVESWGGTIAVESSAERGTTVRLGLLPPAV